MSVYVYAITDAEHRLGVEGATGVGEDPAPLRVVRAGRVAAVVSDAPDNLRAKRRDLKAHQDVLEALGRQGAVLPMRFGMLADDDDAVQAELGRRDEEFVRRLRAVEDRVEFNVKATQDEDAALLEVIRENAEVQRLNELTRGGGGSYDDRIALGEAVSADVQARQTRMTEEIRQALRPLAHDESVGEPGGESFMSVSFLVDRARAEEFANAVRKVSDDVGHGVVLRVNGPLPPYSFV